MPLDRMGCEGQEGSKERKMRRENARCAVRASRFPIEENGYENGGLSPVVRYRRRRIATKFRG